MLNQTIDLLPLEGIKIVLVLFLSFLIGLEREEHRAEFSSQGYGFGGVRTFPLIGLIGYSLALLSGDQLMPVAVGFAVIASFLWLYYKHRLEQPDVAGVTTEMSALATYVIGALVSHGEFWIATTLAVLSVLLLELKTWLENLSHRVPGVEILAFSKFLLLTAVILPVLPNRTYGAFGFNPFKTWLIVVASSGISYGSYLLQKLARGRSSIFLSAVLGGAYSSTATTVVLAKRARHANSPRTWAGAILMASGVMYFRILILVGLFNRNLLFRLLVPFLLLGSGALLGGWLWSQLSKVGASGEIQDLQAKNPLEVSAAFLFAFLFVVLLAATHYAIVYVGRGGVYGLAALSGIVDVDPFILGMTQSANTTPANLAVGGIIIAAASNNMAKGFYAYGFGGREAGRQALALLLALAILGLLPLVWN